MKNRFFLFKHPYGHRKLIIIRQIQVVRGPSRILCRLKQLRINYKRSHHFLLCLFLGFWVVFVISKFLISVCCMCDVTHRVTNLFYLTGVSTMQIELQKTWQIYKPLTFLYCSKYLTAIASVSVKEKCLSHCNILRRRLLCLVHVDFMLILCNLSEYRYNRKNQMKCLYRPLNTFLRIWSETILLCVLLLIIQFYLLHHLMVVITVYIEIDSIHKNI